MPLKECFGQLANMTIRFNNSTKMHYLRKDNEKLKECDQCNLFNKCMFVKYNEMFEELIRLVNDAGISDSRPKLG